MKLSIKKMLMLCFVLLGLSIPQISLSHPFDKIKCLTENYPPYNFFQDGRLQGIAVDLLDVMLKKIKADTDVQEIEVMPWARAYHDVLYNSDTCIFSTTRTEKREKLFKWVGPIASTTIALIAKKNSNIYINSARDLSNYRIGVVREDIGEQLLLAAGMQLKDLKRLGGVHATRRSINKLNFDRIDAWAYEKNVALWEIKKNGFNSDDYLVVYKLFDGNLYYAFNIETPDELILELQTAFDEIKEEGIHQKIMDKYLR
ncbi:substrate-binding periplasmic protein [Psychromonas sp. Urea-02u-13]|uniref:substrate-binding periplasmic protein n=1 Tax=Psychromonas sp. Urea-02u-13 TaxID=2058326 RepID=UPI000C3459C4|nr:ABC transporter substrate-binding protein [Psychromonas sp. Urea-02u-13]PKG39019.1 amino acid ABC transporter substrate-binding protein [Psychromonas sp. Urea-02u-13]